MGCTVSGSSQLRDAREQVAELQRQLRAAEHEKEALRVQTQALEKKLLAKPPETEAVKEVPIQTTALNGTMPSASCEEEPLPSDSAAVSTARTTFAEAATPSTNNILFSAPPIAGSEADERGPGLERDLILPGSMPDLPEDKDVDCTSPQTPSLVQSGDLSESQSESVVEASPGCGQTLSQEATGKLVQSSESTRASTSSPGSQKLQQSQSRSLQCHQCGVDGMELFQDPSDLNNYCERCWSEFYGQPPQRFVLQPLVTVEIFELWADDLLAHLWACNPLVGWPPPALHLPPLASKEEEVWSQVNVRIRRDVVGPHAREQTGRDSLYEGEVVSGKYRIHNLAGQGHFTKAYLAEELVSGRMVCLKRHRNLTVEALSDLMVIGRRMDEVDAGGELFPRLLDAFYDYVCFTVEGLVEGQNCLSLAQSCPTFFCDLQHLRWVAQGVLLGLSHLDKAGIVHNDVKPDNLMWVGSTCSGNTSARSSSDLPCVKIVDFGCARLDRREESGRNWSLAEGGAGHLGKWSPEMALRLPISHQGDVWGMAISLCELHCGRFVWRNEADTAEIVVAQAIGLCELRDGLPSTLMRRSPLDVRLLYTAPPRHFPLRRNSLGQLEALRPARWGLEQVLGDTWRESGKGELRALLQQALVVDPAMRPSACQLLESARFVNPRWRPSPRSQSH